MLYIKIINKLLFECKRAKFRGSPKVLVTKDLKETFFSGLINDSRYGNITKNERF